MIVKIEKNLIGIHITMCGVCSQVYSKKVGGPMRRNYVIFQHFR